MPTVENEQADPKSLETRFGIVMYGGVSLAIYINGVAREFFRAVRGAGVYKLVKALTDRDVVVDVISGTSAGGINGIMLSYALCNGKEFASCGSLWRLDGDVRSLLRSPHGGADAADSLFDSESYYQPRLEAAFREMPEYVEEEGEINSPFKELDLFVTGTDVDGRISTQFDDAGHPIDVKDHRALFLLKHREGRKHPFEPGSSVDGPSTPETTYQALAKLSRITSCFPAAFTPVHVSGSEPPGNETVDGKLQLWGGLGKDACFLDGGVIDNKPFTYTIREIFCRSADRAVERKLFYVEPDPEHFKQPEVASRPNFVQAVIASLIGIPGYESIADDLRLLAQHNTKVQQYKRLRQQLEARARDTAAPRAGHTQRDRELYDRCSLVALSERIIEGILKVNGRAELLSRKDRTAAAALIEAFDKVQDKLRDQMCPDETGGGDVPVFVRNFNVYFRLRRLYRTIYKLVEVLGEIERTPENEEEVNRLTNLWRVLNREIELLDIVRANMERLIDEAPIGWKDRLDESPGTGDTLSQATIDEAGLIWDVVTEGLHRLIDRRGQAAAIMRDAFGGVRDEIKALKEKPGGRLEGFGRETLTAFNKALRGKAKGIISDINEDKVRQWVTENRDELEGRSLSFHSILQLARQFEEDVIGALLPEGGAGDAARHRSAAVRSAYLDFASFDAQLFPIEFVAGLYEKDVIETIRISPLDAERGFSNKGLSDKVSGDALYHFAGFFKRSWRSNDILWGRLDSLCQLTETLLTPEKIERVLKSKMLLGRARLRFFTPHEGEGKGDAREGWDWVPAMHPARLFPHAGRATQEDLAAWLRGLLLEDKPLDRDDFAKTKLARVIEAAQLEVIYEDLPGVITDALEEQARWNQFRYPSDLLKSAARAPEQAGAGGGGKFDPTVFPPVYLSDSVYLPARGKLDAFASVIAAAGAASDAMRNLEKRPAAGTTPMDTGVGQFFSRDYRIGSEALLRDLPPLILLEIVSTTLLVVRNCLLKIFGGQAERIKKYPLYVFGIDLPLRGFHTLVRFMRQAPGSHKVMAFALGVLSVLLLAIGIYWFDPIIWTPPTQLIQGKFHLNWFAIFIGAPLVVLTAEAAYLYQGKVSEWTVLSMLRDGLLALLILLPCFVALAAYVALYDTATGALSDALGGWKWLASGAVFAAILLTFFAPLVAFAMLARLGRWGRSGAGRLREQLQRYFSIPEMLALARRLDLFKDEDVHRLAEELNVFDAASLDEITMRHRELLGDFRAELERKLSRPGAANSRAYTESVAAEGRKVRYSVVIEIYNRLEKARKREAYDRLAEKLAEIDEQHREAVGEGLPRGAAPTEEQKVEAVNSMLEEARRVEALKTNLAHASIESAQRTDDSLRAAELLARRIVEEAAARDRGPGLTKRIAALVRRDDADATPPEAARAKSDEEHPTMLARLEDMMYSINPGAMS
jgi:patatin-related protein